MKTLSHIIMSLALVTPVVATSVAHAQDKSTPTAPSDNSSNKQDVTMDQLPKAVKTTVQRETKGKTPTSITRSDNNGAVAYEIKYVHGTRETTLNISNDGKVVSRNMRSTDSGSTNQPTPPSDQPKSDMKPNQPDGDSSSHPNPPTKPN